MEADEEARRWSEADELAAGIADPARVRDRRNRVFLVLTALIGVSWVTGVALAFALPHGVDSGERDVSDVRATAGLAVETIGFLALVGGFIWARRTGRYVTRWRSIAAPLTRAQRRQAQRVIAGKAPLRPDRTEYLLALAGQNRRTTEGIVPLYGAILLFNSFTLLIDPAPYQVAISSVVVVLFAVAAVQLVLVYRRSGRFIDRISPARDDAPRRVEH
jgi:hypothetical protein